MINKLKIATLSLMAATMTMASQAKSTDGDTICQNTVINPTQAAARVTIGSVIEYKNVTVNGANLSLTEYHIDKNGDGKVDVVRHFINRDGDVFYPQVMHSPFSVLKIIEVYDENRHMWNIVDVEKIGTRKNKYEQVHMPIQKTR